MPSEPVLAWMYGVSTCGWPGRPCRRRSWCSLSAGSRPRPISTRRAPARRGPSTRRRCRTPAGPCRDRASRCRNSQLMISSELKLVPMWPDHAPAIMYSVLMRASAANARARATSDAVARRAGAELGDGHELKLERSRPGRSVGHPSSSSLLTARRLMAHCCERLLAARQRDGPVGEQPLGHHPVVRIVDVEAFVALGEERHQHVAGNRPPLEHDARPGDLERRVLHVHRRQRLVRRAVPRLLASAPRRRRRRPAGRTAAAATSGRRAPPTSCPDAARTSRPRAASRRPPAT